MASQHWHGLFRKLRGLVNPYQPGTETDRQLLQRFAVDRDEASFATLVERHGSMILGVCQRLLRNRHDTEDAFQATFLVLACKASSASWHDSIGGWLYAVACRVASKARARAAQRRRQET